VLVKAEHRLADLAVELPVEAGAAGDRPAERLADVDVFGPLGHEHLARVALALADVRAVGDEPVGACPGPMASSGKAGSPSASMPVAPSSVPAV